MTGSVPGGQRGSSKGPAEMSALWGGNNSATFHHFIVISLYLSSTQDTREEGQEVNKRQRKGGERRLPGGTRGSWSFERGEVWIVTFKKVSHNNGLIPTYETNKKQTDQTKGQNRKEKNEKRTEKQTHAWRINKFWMLVTPALHKWPFFFFFF